MVRISAFFSYQLEYKCQRYIWVIAGFRTCAIRLILVNLYRCMSKSDHFAVTCANSIALRAKSERVKDKCLQLEKKGTMRQKKYYLE